MNITILDDYQKIVPTLASFSRLAGHSVRVWNDHTKQVKTLASRLKNTEALVLIRERTPVPAVLLQKLPKLKIISQNGPCPHIDIGACTRRAVIAGYGQAFGMKVLAWGRETTLAKARADNVAVAASRQALFEQSDVLTLHMRLIDETRGIVTAGDLARMKPTALFVNTSRAGLVEPRALERALR